MVLGYMHDQALGVHLRSPEALWLADHLLSMRACMSCAQVACQTNTGLIARFIGSPEVARAAGLATALAAKQAARRKISAPFALPNAMLDSTTASSVHIDRCDGWPTFCHDACCLLLLIEPLNIAADIFVM